MKFWLSKYALTGGIKEVNVDVDEKNLSREHVYPDGYYIGFKVGRDIHMTSSEAAEVAEKMRDKEIKHLQKRIDALKRLRF